MKHFLITRYNLGLYDQDRDHLLWMKRRADLFRSTIRSVQRQSIPTDWLLFIDERTIPGTIPKGPYQEVECKAEWVDSLPDGAPFLREFLAQNCQLGELVITQRLDNDDELAPFSCQLVRGLVETMSNSSSLPMVVSMANGSTLYKGQRRDYHYAMNPFIAFAERMPEDGREPITAWADTHTNMGKHGTVFDVKTKDPAWTQVWHEENLYNGRTHEEAMAHQRGLRQ